MTYLTKIKFDDDTYGYQETPAPGSRRLLHLYDENGDQLDGGNGYFPNAKMGDHRPSIMCNCRF